MKFIAFPRGGTACKASKTDTFRTVVVSIGVAWSIATLICGAMEIDSFSANGELVAGSVPTGTWVRVEWTSSLETGIWHRTWQTLNSIEPGSNTTLLASVPMFYRVVAEPDPAPVGMVLVDAGTFRMGNADTNEVGEWWYAREIPVHEVETSAFYIDRYEVSNERMRQTMQWAFDQGLLLAGPNGVTNAVGDPHELLNLDDSASEIGFGGGVFSVEAGRENFPCVMVTWYGAMAYCSYSSQAQRLDDCIDMADWSCDFAANGYRLATEAEWEKAARGGLVDHYFPWVGSGGSWSNHIDGTKANYQNSNDGYDNGATPLAYYNGSQSPEGVDMANGYGVYDMAGNVYEWCWDWYSGSWYSKVGATVSDTTGPPSGGSRLLRGGAWYRTQEYLRCSFRHFSNPDFSYYAFGFRCVRSAGL